MGRVILEFTVSDVTGRNSKPAELMHHNYVGETGLEPAKLSGSQNRRDTNFATLRIAIIYKKFKNLSILDFISAVPRFDEISFRTYDLLLR